MTYTKPDYMKQNMANGSARNLASFLECQAFDCGFNESFRKSPNKSSLQSITPPLSGPCAVLQTQPARLCRGVQRVFDGGEKKRKPDHWSQKSAEESTSKGGAEVAAFRNRILELGSVMMKADSNGFRSAKALHVRQGRRGVGGRRGRNDFRHSGNPL